ncbi:MAG: PEPxxWA-CTERM sorting domain-containing protein [Sandarakinorhabdus sp.]|nr:PEPxxWA-CTERM sorting domain-containing protein [Sandarakinorhabdus sp.]
MTFAAGSADAANLAIFGENQIGTLYDDSHTVTYVSDAQLATVGFLDAYDAFVYTRDGFSFGVGLSLAAAANVKTYVTGNIVLFNGDWQDDIANPETAALFNNALAYVLGGSGKGYIGEYRGAFAAYSANGDGNNPIGLVQGTSGPSGFQQGGSSGQIDLTAAGVISPITADTTFPYNPAAVEFGAELSGENPAKVLARFENGNAAIIASSVGEISNPGVIPEPATWAMMILGFGMVGFASRRRRRVAFRAA